MPYLSYAKSFKRDSKTEYKAFTQLKQEDSKYTILCKHWSYFTGETIDDK